MSQILSKGYAHYTFLFLPLVPIGSSTGGKKRKYIHGKARGCSFFSPFKLWKHVQSSHQHFLFIQQPSSSSKALNPTIAPVVLWCTRRGRVDHVCPSFISLSIPFIPWLFSESLSEMTNDMAEEGFQICMPCQTGIWTLVFEAHSFIIHHQFIHHPFLHRIHPCIYQSIRYHLSINPLLFTRIHPGLVKKTRPLVFASLKLQSLIENSDKPALFYREVKKVRSFRDIQDRVDILTRADQNIKDCVFKEYFLNVCNGTTARTTWRIDIDIDVVIVKRFPVPNGPPTNLVVFNETTTTLNARWNPAPGRVQNYKITYVPTAGGRSLTVSHPTDQHTALCSYCVFWNLQ